MANRYPRVTGSRKISQDYDNINEMIDMVEEDVVALENKHQSTTQTVNSLQTQINELVVNGDSSPAVAQAAIDANGHDYQNLKLRLDTEHTQLSEQLADKAQKVEVESLTTTVEGLQSTVDTKAAISYVDTQVATRATTGYVDDAVASVSNGTPESFENLAAIQAAYPNGDTHVKLNLTNGYVYKWDGTAWVQGWVYQAEQLGDGAATYVKRTRLGEMATIILGASTTILPDLDTTTRTLIFNNTFFIVAGKTRYSVTDGVVLDFSHLTSDTGIVIYFNTVTQSFAVVSQLSLSAIPESCVLFALIYRISNRWKLTMNCEHTINKRPVNDFTRLASSYVYAGANSSIPLFNKNTGNITFYGTTFIVSGSNRYSITETKEIILNDYHTGYTGYGIYFNTATNEFYASSTSILTGITTTSILIAVSYKNNEEDRWYLAMNGQYKTVPNENPNNSNYLFVNRIVPNDFNYKVYPAIGDPESYFDYTNDTFAKVYALFDEWMINNPEYITRTLRGNGTGGEPIYSYRFTPERAATEGISSSNNLPYPKILLSGAIHGNENIGIAALCYLMQRICNEWENDEVLRYLRHFVIFDVVPLKNPGSYDAKDYYYPNGVNVNRNFDYLWSSSTDPAKGDAPFSVLEAQVARDWVLSNLDAMHSVDIHARGNRGNVGDSQIYWLSEGSDNFVMMATNTIEDLSAKWQSRYSNLKGKGVFGYATKRPSPGTFRSWSQEVAGLPSTTWEGFSRSTTLSTVEDSQIVTMNAEMLGQYVIDLLRFYKQM